MSYILNFMWHLSITIAKLTSKHYGIEITEFSYVEDLQNKIPTLLQDPQDREILERLEPVGEGYYH
jgi:hypothetical protein